MGFSFTVKPLPPFNVQVKDTDGFYNITWSNNNSHLDCFTYRVRIRESQHPKVTPAKTSATLPFLLIILTSFSFPQDPVHSLLIEERFIQLDHSKLKLHQNYSVDVQVKMCPGNLYQGPWSEWSPAADWRTTGTSVETAGRRTMTVSLV